MPDLSSSSLICHPSGQCAAVRQIEVSAHFATGGTLNLCYRLYGELAGLALPVPQAPGPVDGLWQYTCCEAFIAAVDGPEYREFNFSPSGQWAAYGFNDYRERAPDFHATAAPQISFCRLADGFQLVATLAPSLLPAGDVLHIALSSVIAASDGSKSYWALRHCAEQPDFHLRQSFALTLKVSKP